MQRIVHRSLQHLLEVGLVIFATSKLKFSIFALEYLKNRFRQIVAAPSKLGLMHLLLTSRAATAISNDLVKNLKSYGDWYKQTIGDMKFVLSTEEFKAVLAVL